MGGDLALIGTALAVGLGAAFLPVFINAEVYVVALSATVDGPMLVLLLVVHAVATTVGKGIVFQLARRGTRHLTTVEVDPRPPRTSIGRGWRRWRAWYSGTRFAAAIRRLSARLIALLDHRYYGGVTVFSSSLVGVPPLAVVTILAGASRQPQWLFLVNVFVGRLLQFLAIAFLIHRVI